jgi:hypothetical protein
MVFDFAYSALSGFSNGVSDYDSISAQLCRNLELHL